MSSIIRFLRLAMQSLILGLGAYLVIDRSATVGAMFAASILLGRSLQPIEQIVGSWRSLVSARASFLRIRTLLVANPLLDLRLELPRPLGQVAVEGLSYAPLRSTKAILRNVSFRIEPGEVIGIIGPSGAGKSTLVRHIVGVLKPSTGAVRLDAAGGARELAALAAEHADPRPGGAAGAALPGLSIRPSRAGQAIKHS